MSGHRVLLVIALRLWALYWLVVQVTALVLFLAGGGLSRAYDAQSEVWIARSLTTTIANLLSALLVLWQSGRIARYLLPELPGTPVTPEAQHGGVRQAALACVGLVTVLGALASMAGPALHTLGGSTFDRLLQWEFDQSIWRHGWVTLLVGVLLAATPRVIDWLRGRKRRGEVRP